MWGPGLPLRRPGFRFIKQEETYEIRNQFACLAVAVP